MPLKLHPFHRIPTWGPYPELGHAGKRTPPGQELTAVQTFLRLLKVPSNVFRNCS